MSAGGRSLDRRTFVAVLGLATAGVALRAARAQEAARAPVESPTPSQITGAPVTEAETPGATMEGEGYRPVRRSAKPGARASMTADARDALEHQLSCPCPCTLDVYTCRTSMPCGFSPAIHRDVIGLVEGGHSADEIMAAFEQTYGEQILMAPKKTGFNWAGYIAPFAAIGGGAVVLGAMMRRWSRRAAEVAAAAQAERARRPSANGHAAAAPNSAPGASPDAYTADATPEELARLEAAVRGGADRG